MTRKTYGEIEKEKKRKTPFRLLNFGITSTSRGTPAYSE